ncbi:MAG: hypothetical protein R3C68_06870 [Myxococcota bacterium]
MIPVIYFIWSLKLGPKASTNPWGATGLEWSVSSPPPTHNFATIPVVDEEAYDYPRLHGGPQPALTEDAGADHD